MLEKRIAQLAERLGIPMPRVVGQARLGLAGTIRFTQTVPLLFSQRVREYAGQFEAGFDEQKAVEEMNATNVWAWIEVRGSDRRWSWPRADQNSDALRRCSEGKIPPEGLSMVLATARWTISCVPASRGEGLFVLGFFPPRRRPHFAQLLLTEFTTNSSDSFNARDLFTVVATQTRVGIEIDRREIERAEVEDREFITTVRRHLEALRNHAVGSTHSAPFELVSKSPLRLRMAKGEAWPRAFTRPGTVVQVPIEGGGPRPTFRVLDVSDDGDVISFASDAHGVLGTGEVETMPGDAPLKRMREALDRIAMGTNECHGKLLSALTRPEGLADLPPSVQKVVAAQGDRQAAATALAKGTPDIALIHGPPGTGKTTVICRIVEDLVRRGNKILLVAPTHVALDNVLERVGNSPGVTAIRLGSEDNVEHQAHRFLLRNRSLDLARRLAVDLRTVTKEAPVEDPVAELQRKWADRVGDNKSVGALLLLNANLVCATPIGIAMAREFRNVEAVFDVMIMDEASKATITDFLVPAARAKRWILVGDHRQLPPYIDLGELEAVISERIRRIEVPDRSESWASDLGSRLRWHFDNRMHPDPERRKRAWNSLVEEISAPLGLEDEVIEELAGLDQDPQVWRDARQGRARATDGATAGEQAALKARNTALRLGAELLELQGLALPSVFEHLTRLPASRSVRLNYQHRMHPALASFSSTMVYEGDYPSAPDTATLGLEIPSLEAPSIWIDTAFARSERRYEHPRNQNWTGGHYQNKLEVEVTLEVVKTCATWAVQSWRGDPRERGRGEDAPFEIGVICFYLQQALALRNELFPGLPGAEDPWRRRWVKPAANGAPIELHVSIVDRFQGREKDLVVLCTTRSNPKGNRGHVDNLNRLNVAVTRARHKRIVVGDSTTLAGQEGGRRRAEDDLLRRLYETSERKKKWGQALGGRR